MFGVCGSSDKPTISTAPSKMAITDKMNLSTLYSNIGKARKVFRLFVMKGGDTGLSK